MGGGRSPHGERGLKLIRSCPICGKFFGSLPARGAWIEMILLMFFDTKDDVAPRTGSVD